MKRAFRKAWDSFFDITQDTTFIQVLAQATFIVMFSMLIAMALVTIIFIPIIQNMP